MKHLQRIKLSDLVFLDIETAREVEHLQKDTALYDSWEYLMKYKNDSRTLEQSYEQDAALYAEFSRIVCITVGTFRTGKINLTTFYDKDEKVLLKKFMTALSKFTAAKSDARLCGHFIIDFDLPFILKRCIVHQVEAHPLVDVGDKKPWEVTTLDTKMLWKSTGARTSSLINIAVCLGIKSPKDDISGADVGRVYYEEGDAGLIRIVRYCEKDVVTTMRVYLRMTYKEDVTEVDVSEVEIEEAPNVMEMLKDTGYITEELKQMLKQSFKSLSLKDREKGLEVVAAAICQHSSLDEETREELLEC